MFVKGKCIGRDGNEMEYTTLSKRAWRVILAVGLLCFLYGMTNPAGDGGDSWRDAHPERTRINLEYDRALRDFERGR
jgi:hypothetical protein